MDKSYTASSWVIKEYPHLNNLCACNGEIKDTDTKHTPMGCYFLGILDDTDERVEFERLVKEQREKFLKENNDS